MQGALTTAEAASSVPAPMIALTLSLCLALYVVLILAYVSMLHLARNAARARAPMPAAGSLEAHRA